MTTAKGTRRGGTDVRGTGTGGTGTGGNGSGGNGSGGTRSGRPRSAGHAEQAGSTGHVNEIRLRGRLAAVATEVALPSGDVVSTFRVVVDRTPARRGSTGAARVDTLDCKALSAGARTRVARLGQGDLVEVRGWLQRRFFRAGGAPASRYEVVATSVVRVARADTAPRATMTG